MNCEVNLLPMRGPKEAAVVPLEPTWWIRSGMFPRCSELKFQVGSGFLSGHLCRSSTGQLSHFQPQLIIDQPSKNSSAFLELPLAPPLAPPLASISSAVTVPDSVSMETNIWMARASTSATSLVPPPVSPPWLPSGSGFRRSSPRHDITPSSSWRCWKHWRTHTGYNGTAPGPAAR